MRNQAQRARQVGVQQPTAMRYACTVEVPLGVLALDSWVLSSLTAEPSRFAVR
jgi:hypothetical protein